MPKHIPCSPWISSPAAIIQLGDGIVNGSGEERQHYQHQYQYQEQQIMQMMILKSICIKMACVRSSWWFCVRISVLEHLLCRVEALGQEDGDIPWGVGTHDGDNVHQTVLCIQEGTWGAPLAAVARTGGWAWLKAWACHASPVPHLSPQKSHLAYTL